jgi:hypothetical protein
VAQETKVPSDRRPRTESLNRELAVYATNLRRWLEDHRNAHVLIKGDEVVGFYETRDEALAAGYSRFGVVPLLVKQIQESEPIYYIPNVLR